MIVNMMSSRSWCITLLLGYLPGLFVQQVQINEVMTANSSAIMDAHPPE